MQYKYGFGLAAILALLLTGCGGASNPDDVPHSDTLTLDITADNALDIAAEVYRVVAVDVPYTASVAMTTDPVTGAMIVNSNACVAPTDPTAPAPLRDGGSGGMMGMGMDMIFTNCELATTPLDSAHRLVVNGRCTNNGTGVETVTGDVISLTKLGAVAETVTLHAFSVTRDSDNMTNAAGTLHGVGGNAATIVTFVTPTPFAGTASAPTAGVMVITGAGNSRLKLTVIDSGANFTLEVDTGNGGYAEPQTLVWGSDFWPLIP